MEARDLIGRRVALLLMGKKANGEDDWVVVAGTGIEVRGVVCVDLGKDKRPLEIRPEWISRVKLVDADVRDTLADADFYVPLRVGDLPEETSPGEYENTGLKWPT
jgi:hypothetical protein